MSNERWGKRGYYSPGQDIHFKMTTPEEETQLFFMARGTDVAAETAREFLIHNHLMFARSEALKLSKGALPEDEVVSAANLAIMKAMKSFDYSRGHRFTTYLRPFIRGEIAALWETKYNSCGVIDPSMCADYSISNETMNTIAENTSGVMGEEQINFGKTRKNSTPSGEEHPGETLDLQQFNRSQLTEALGSLKPQEQELIQKVYVEGLTYTATGLARNPPVSRERIRVQHNEVILKLRAKLARRGVAEVL